jgi:hypothetical protein
MSYRHGSYSDGNFGRSLIVVIFIGLISGLFGLVFKPGRAKQKPGRASARDIDEAHHINRQFSARRVKASAAKARQMRLNKSAQSSAGTHLEK